MLQPCPDIYESGFCHPLWSLPFPVLCYLQTWWAIKSVTNAKRKDLVTSHQSQKPCDKPSPPKFTPSLSLHFTSTQFVFVSYSCFHCAKSGQSSTWCLNLLPNWKALSSSAHPIVGARWPEWRGLWGEISHWLGCSWATMSEAHQPLMLSFSGFTGAIEQTSKECWL